MKENRIISSSVATEDIAQLEREIAAIEAELLGVESRLNAFESIIRTQLNHKIIQIRELSALYKSQKLAKKAKRLEQKKRGKNYQEPKGILRTEPSKQGAVSAEQPELKRLYKEAIVHVHPDKFQDEDESNRANDLTIQLIDLYKSGDLEKLILFHEHILTGNAMSHKAFQPESIVNPKSMLIFLKRKKLELLESLEGLMQSYTFTVLSTYQDPNSFINELSLQFDQRIAQLLKRTR